MTRFLIVIFIFILPNVANANLTKLIQVDDDIEIFDFIREIVIINYKNNGWTTMITFGNCPDEFYKSLHSLGTMLTNDLNDNYDIENVPPYYPHSVIMFCKDFQDFESMLLKATLLPNWHPHTNLYIYFELKFEEETVGHIFFALWYKFVCNVILMHYDKSLSTFKISEYSPYITEYYRLQHNVGCHTVNKVGVPISSLSDSLVCEETCENITLTSKWRRHHLGTCIGFNYHSIPLGDIQEILRLDLLRDNSKNLHGFVMTAYASEIPFLEIRDNENGSVTLHQRDGMVWNTVMLKMNFSIDFSLNTDKTFSFGKTVEQLFSYSFRQVDLYLGPLYVVDLVIVELDLCFPYKDSGVCIIAHRAGFETSLLDINITDKNFASLVQFGVCFLSVWFTFSLFNRVEKGNLTFDQIGKDFMNAIRNVLTVSLFRPPKKRIFRIFLAVSIWSFFVVNFSMQAAIVSFFTAFKRGKEIETFDDILEKGYPIEGMASPDIVLPDTEDRFIAINDKVVPAHNMHECISRMSNDSHRFCLVDCAVGRYMKTNSLNDRGEQYLHVISDRIHSHYLSFAFPRHCPLTNYFNKIMIALVEGGIIKKWEDYKYTGIKEDAVVKSLSLADLIGIFKCFWLLITVSCAVFVFELIFAIAKWFGYFFMKCGHYICNRLIAE